MVKIILNHLKKKNKLIRITIRPALPGEHTQLSDIMFAAKFYWDYPEELKLLWRKELTITPEMLQEQDFFVAEVGSALAGFYSTVENKEDYYVGELFHPQGLWLENMFVHPDWIGQGFGHRLMQHLLKRCREAGIPKICFYADPHATGFYERYGGRFIGAYPSSVPGRNLPLYELKISAL